MQQTEGSDDAAANSKLIWQFEILLAQIHFAFYIIIPGYQLMTCLTCIGEVSKIGSQGIGCCVIIPIRIIKRNGIRCYVIIDAMVRNILPGPVMQESAIEAEAAIEFIREGGYR